MTYQCELVFAINFKNGSKIKEFKKFISEDEIGFNLSFDQFKQHKYDNNKILYFYHEGKYAEGVEDNIRKYQYLANNQGLENIYILIGEEVSDITLDHEFGEYINPTDTILNKLFNIERKLILDPQLKSVSVEEYMKQNPEG